MNFKEIIYLVEFPFCQRDYDRFGIDIFKKKNLSIKIIDISEYIYPEFIVSQHNVPINSRELIKVKNRTDLKNTFSSLGTKSFVISMIPYRFKRYFVYRLLSKYQIKFAIYIGNALPVLGASNPSFIQEMIYILKNINQISSEKVFNYFLRKLPANFIRINNATLSLVSGGSNKHYPLTLIGKNTISPKLHYLDYDIYLKLKTEDSKPLVPYDYCVFVDEYVPFHPDYQLTGNIPPISADEYYPPLCNFFKKIEIKFNVRTIIAAHPRSDYETHTDYFENRLLIKNKTAELVKDARFVVLHSSTAISFCILYKKPIIFISNNNINKSIYGRHIYKMAENFGKSPVNLDNQHIFISEDELSFDDNQYDLYRNKYIKEDETEELPFWDIVANNILNLDQ